MNNSKLVLLDLPEERVLIDNLLASLNCNLSDPCYQLMRFFNDIVQPKFDGVLLFLQISRIFYKVDQRMIVSLILCIKVFVYVAVKQTFCLSVVWELVHQFRLGEITCIKVCQLHRTAVCMHSSIVFYKIGPLLNTHQARVRIGKNIYIATFAFNRNFLLFVCG